LEEVVDYSPARHHNQRPPDLRIDDEGYLTEIRNLVAELRTLNALLETTRREPKEASDAVVNLLAIWTPSLTGMRNLLRRAPDG
jgi:hypothetical protein